MGRIPDRFAYSDKAFAEEGTSHMWWLGRNPERLHVTTLTPKNVVVEAGANYPVLMAPIGYRLVVDGVETWVPVDDRFVVYRGDTGHVFGTAQDRYAAAQNQEAADVLEGLYADRQIEIVGAGTYGEGAVFWIQARDVCETTIAGDRHQALVSVTLGHDGNIPFSLFRTLVRMICENTVDAGIASGSDRIVFKHTGDIAGKIAQAREALSIGREQQARYAEWAESVRNERLAAGAVEAVEHLLFPTYGAAAPDATPKQLSAHAAAMTKRENRVEAFSEILREEVDAFGLTGWTMWNAITGFSDHTAFGVHRGTDRADSAMFGGIAQFKKRGFEIVNSVVEEFAIA